MTSMVAAPVDPVSLAKEILSKTSGGTSIHDPFKILSMAPGMPVVTLDTPVPEARRNYVKLAGLLHPDRLSSAFPQATECFQVLVKVFEAACNPNVRKQMLAASTAKKKKTAATPAGSRKKRASPDEDDEDLILGVAASKRRGAATKTTKKKSAAKKKRTRAVDSDDDEFDDESSEEEEEDDEFDMETLGVGSASPQFTEVPERSNVGCFRTPVGCPNCRTRWQPDDNKLYLLFMYFGVPTVCETCLLRYGPNTCNHGCPHCNRVVDYDVSMYNKKSICPHKQCGKGFGYMWYKVSLKIIEEIMAGEAKKEEAKQKAEERQRRAAARSGGGGDAGGGGGGGKVEDSDAVFLELLGECIINDQCPVCRKTVKSKHKKHLEECNQKKKESGGDAVKKERKIRNFVVGEKAKKTTKKRASSKKEKTKK